MPLSLPGPRPKRAHINALIAGDVRLDDFQILAFGGGFSWGDDHGAGVIQALRLKTNIGDRLLDFVAAREADHRHLQRIPDPGQPGIAAGDRWGLHPAIRGPDL